MSKIRIPRKLKKYGDKKLKHYNFPNVPRLSRYYSYFVIEDGIKTHNMSAEELCKTFGRYTMDDVIWWHWIRKKKLGIEPQMSPKFQEYWDFFKSKGCL